jgi:sortase A
MERRRRRLILTAEVLLTISALVPLYLVWNLFIDDAIAGNRQAHAAESLEASWQQVSDRTHTDLDSTTDAQQTSAPPEPGEAFAVLRIPRFGEDWRRPVIEGTELEQLAGGVGHYSGTALPGEVGNFSVAGHRLTNGSAFTDIDKLVPGDVVGVRTPTDWFVYEVTGSEIVQPHEVDVIAPVPRGRGQEPTQRLMTLTTCHPLYGSSERYIVYTRLIDARPVSEGVPQQLQREAI